VLRALVQIPGPVAVQANDSPSMSSVTVQVVVGSRGCLMRWRAPTRRGPGSRRRIDLTDGVHKGQRSTLEITAHTRSAGASMSMVTLAFMVAILGGLETRFGGVVVDVLGVLVTCRKQVGSPVPRS
jgi:hypothetical protein